MKKSKILEPKRINRIRIAKFISNKVMTSKAEIAQSLNLSMPTTLQNVKELINDGIVVEEGEYESTGGRKAKAISIAKDAGYSLGVDITNNHLTLVMVNTKKEIVESNRISKKFEDKSSYYSFLKSSISDFIEETDVDKNRIIGIGFSLPGIVNKDEKLLSRSHTLRVNNLSFRDLGDSLNYPYELENDANSAAYAEKDDEVGNAVYISLSNTVGGAIYLDKSLFNGENFKSGEFGHMIIEKNGKSCYCGKEGCMDAYCSAKILQKSIDNSEISLDEFFERVRENDKEYLEIWDRYLDDLALSITNIRMIFDSEIILGGYVGRYIGEFMGELSRKIEKYNNFDLDASYIKTGRYGLEASAYGIALAFIDSFFNGL